MTKPEPELASRPPHTDRPRPTRLRRVATRLALVLGVALFVYLYTEYIAINPADETRIVPISVNLIDHDPNQAELRYSIVGNQQAAINQAEALTKQQDLNRWNKLTTVNTQPNKLGWDIQLPALDRWIVIAARTTNNPDNPIIANWYALPPTTKNLNVTLQSPALNEPELVD